MTGRALVVGGLGALGAAVTQHLRAPASEVLIAGWVRVASTSTKWPSPVLAEQQR